MARPYAQCFVVLGMHRSGTSAVAGGLEAAGVDFGTALMPAARDNPRGFFEDTRLVALNERLIAFQLQTWDAVAPSPPSPEAAAYTGFHHEAVAILADLAASASNDDGACEIGLKDPRASLFVEFWSRVLAEADLVPVWLVCLRHPAQVAKSLFDRNRFSRAKSCALWLKYNLSLLQGLVSSGWSAKARLLSFEALCEDRNTRVQSVDALFAGGDLNPDAFADFFDAHLTSPDVTRDPKSTLEALAIEVYDYLLLHGIPAEDVLEGWQSRWRRMGSLLSLIDLQYQHYEQFKEEEVRWLRDLESTVEAKEQELKRVGEQLENLDAYVNKLLASLDSQQAYQQKLEALLRENEPEKARMRRELALALSRAKTYHQSASELEEVLSSRVEELAQRDLAIQRLDQNLQDQQNELAALYSSTSWRLSYPVRALRRLLGRILPGDADL